MTRHHLNRTPRIFAAGLALTMTFAPVGGLVSAQASGGMKPAAQSAPAAPQSVLLFPIDNNAGTAAAAVGPMVDFAIKQRLNTIGVFKSTTFTRLLAPVQRGIDDNVLSKDDITPPFSDPQKAGKIAKEVSTDDYLVGSLESFSADPATKKVTVEVSVGLYNSGTGAAVRTAAFSGTGVPSSNGDDLAATTQSAVNDVAGKIVAALDGNVTHGVPQVIVQSRHNNAAQGILLTLLTGGLLGVILHNSNHSSPTSGNSVVSGGSTGIVIPGLPIPSPPQ